jgi:hypothetical protein
MERIVVAIDPATTSGEDSDETGIVVAGRGVDGDAYVLRDLSCRLSSNGWGNRAINAYREFRADRIVAEVNNGGDLVEDVIRVIDRNVSFKAVHASRGKVVRAEPISSLYEQKRVHHVGGHLRPGVAHDTRFNRLDKHLSTHVAQHGDKNALGFISLNRDLCVVGRLFEIKRYDISFEENLLAAHTHAIQSKLVACDVYLVRHGDT